MHPEKFSKLLSTTEVADLLGLSGSHLSRLRMTGGGPSFVKIGTRVAYDPGDLRAWVEAQKRQDTQGADVRPGRSE